MGRLPAGGGGASGALLAAPPCQAAQLYPFCTPSPSPDLPSSPPTHINSLPQDFDYQPWHQISAAAKDFVGRLLTKDPARRMTVAEGLTHPWITDQAADVPLSTGAAPGGGSQDPAPAADGADPGAAARCVPPAGLLARCSACRPCRLRRAARPHRSPLLLAPWRLAAPLLQRSSAAWRRSRTRTASSACS